MSIFHRLISLSIFFVLLVSCTAATSTNDSNSIPTVSDLESLSTPTARPSFTPSPSITPDQAVYDATQSVVQTKVAQFPRVCTENYSRPKYSPNDLWMEELCYSKNDRDLVLTLSNRETRLLWRLPYREYIPHLDFDPDGGMSVVHWSKDGRYAYFTSFPRGSAGECFYGRLPDTGFGLFRIDLETGHTVSILPVNDDYFWYSFSISPTDRRFVYGVRSLNLKVLDVKTGQRINVAHEADFSQGGGYVWSPDGLKFVYSTVTSNDRGERFGYSLRLVDTQSGSEQILLESPNDCFEAISWTEDNTLILEKNYNEAFVEFDLISNQIISESTTTP